MRARLILVTLAAFLGAASSAEAMVTSITVENGALTVIGSAGADSPSFAYLNPANGSSPGYSRVTDGAGVPLSIAAPCQKTAPAGQAPATNAVWCKDGGFGAADLATLTLSLGDGGDNPTLSECFATANVDLGDGPNTFIAPLCSAGTLHVGAGSGKDTLTVPDGSGTNVTAGMGAGDDSAYGGGGNDTLSGGPGNDYLVGGAGSDTLQGDADDDSLLGGAGNDQLDGGDDDDAFDRSLGISNDPALGADEYRGGAGTDTVYLDAHPAGMVISLDDVANDGSPAEGDNFHSDLESIHGTTKNDTFTGSAGPDTFDGAAGDDVIRGGDGADALDGGTDNDSVYGDAGNDTVYGDYGNDTVDGGPGRDNIFGDLANCSAAGCPAYDDTIFARDDELDQVQCGAGADTARVDAIDVVAQDGFESCESVDRAAAAPVPAVIPAAPAAVPTAPGALPALLPAASFKTTGRASIAKGTKVTVTCPAACSFTATIGLTAASAKARGLGKKALTIGTAKGTLLKAGSQTVTVKLTTKARAKLRKIKRQSSKLTLTAQGPDGKPTVLTTALTLKS